MNHRTVIFIILAGLMLACQPQTQRQPKIEAQTLKEHVYYLASDSLRGRFPGTPGGKAAAEYIAERFQDYGLKPLYSNYFQEFEITTGVEAGRQNKLVVGTTSFRLAEDYTPLPYSANGEVKAEAIFAGYGMVFDDDTLQWDSYSGLDVKGKWVLLLRGDPELKNDQSGFVPYSGDRYKIITAYDKGAAGVLLVSGPAYSQKDGLTAMKPPRVISRSAVPAIHIRRQVANAILQNQTVAGLETHSNKRTPPQTFATGSMVSARAEVMGQKAATQNVVGLVPAQDAPHSYIVIGAHYDHLGMGGEGSGSRVPKKNAVHNGADDNASGVATLLELAEYFADKPEKLRHNLIFAAFGAEERGLLGSKYYVKHATIDMGQVALMLNFDMTGRLDTTDNELIIQGIGTAKELRSRLESSITDTLFNYQLSEEGYGASDHASFYQANIPVLSITTGPHTDYHKPIDDADRLNYPGQARVTQWAAQVLEAFATSEEALTYQSTGIKRKTRHGKSLKVTLGIMPGYGEETDGLKVDGVRPDGPAGKGGMKKGDIITAINGKRIGNIYDYMNRLKTLSPGQMLDVEILREGKTITLAIKV